MSNEGILPILYSIDPYPPFDIRILSFDILVEARIKEYVIYPLRTTIAQTDQKTIGQAVV
jgi:hypothetical protein